jgi:hypothetical protein
VSRDTALLVFMILSSASWLLTHLTLWGRVLRASRFPLLLRAVSLAPPLTHVLGWMAGQRYLCALWVANAALYGALWSIS